MPRPVGGAQRYMPGLDGLRAFAVCAVIAYHLRLPWAPGGLLGVGVFFTLSGYLITDLLLGERDVTGHLKFRTFWARRARRLLPALFLMLAVVLVWVLLLDPSQLPALRGDLAAASLYVSNWWSIAQHTSYFARFEAARPLDHLWSLAVEEQFYLVWPWVLWLALRVSRGRWRIAVTTLAIAAASAAAMALLYKPGYDPTRVYEGTDTRACGLLVGAALAVVWPSRSLHEAVGRWRRWLLDGIGVAALIVIALFIWRTSEYTPFLYRGGIALLSVATAVLVAVLAHPAPWLGRVLGWEPVRWLGVRSYGIYLWHYPIIALTASSAMPRAGQAVPIDALEVGATITVASLSWQFVEEPIRRGALQRAWVQIRSSGWRQNLVPRASWAGPASAVAIVLLAGPSLAAVTNAPGTGVAAAWSSRASSAQHATSPHRASAPSPSPPPATTTSCRDVAYIGDSTSEGMVSENYLPNPAERLDARLAQVGVASTQVDISGARSIVETLPGQINAHDAARQLVAQGLRRCWIIALGTNDTADAFMGSDVGLDDRINQMLSVIGNQPVMWVAVKSLLTDGPYAEANMQAWNTSLARACPKHPNMRVFDWPSLADDSWFVSDGTHYTSTGYAERASLTADALAQAFPASGRQPRECLVR